MSKNIFNILYVDDEPSNLYAFKATFRRDYNVLTAENGHKGIEIIRNNPIDLVITDQRMPEMTGIQFLEKIIPEYPDTIRMVLTGFSDMEAIIEAINSGRVFRYITKPWDENDLKMIIENARQYSELQKSRKKLLIELQQKVEDQEKTLKLFMKYVPPTVVEKALKATEESIFDGELRHVTVLFCDMRDFTKMCDGISPKEVVSFLNDYYAILTDVIQKYEGTVNQYVGDEIFAVFGAPKETLNNEKNAVLCSLEMIKVLKTLNDKYASKLGDEICVGIGINSGEVVAGNLGSESKIDYSITGDTVNTGKRIETISKEHRNSIFVSEEVYRLCEKFVRAKKYDSLSLKGIFKTITVYEITGGTDE